ncbi:MAG: aldose 1-epimerase [Casimicrobium sp.]
MNIASASKAGSSPILLTTGSAECEIWPHKGGSIARWTINGQNMLRAAQPHAAKETFPLGMASFPLVPYSNRIGHGRFDWNGTTVKLEPNFPPEPHAIHGTGWTASWDVESHNARDVTLVHSHKADHHWPWHFDAIQRICLSEYALTIEMVAHNLSDQMVPLAFGHHPDFDSDQATLTFNAHIIWQTGADGLPERFETPDGLLDFSDGQTVADCALDNGYAGWDGNATIRWKGRPLQLNIYSDMSAAVVYIPRGESYFCFEPVPHIINALNLPERRPPMPTVAPGAQFTSQIQYRATDA